MIRYFPLCPFSLLLLILQFDDDKPPFIFVLLNFLTKNDLRIRIFFCLSVKSLKIINCLIYTN